MQDPITEITNRQNVKLSSWVSAYATVNGVDGLTVRSDGSTLQNIVSAAPYATYRKATLVGKEYHGYYEMEREIFEAATILEDGQTVLAGGQSFKVKVMSGNGGRYAYNHDPIHFTPVK